MNALNKDRVAATAINVSVKKCGTTKIAARIAAPPATSPIRSHTTSISDFAPRLSRAGSGV